MIQTLATFVVPFRAERSDQVAATLDALGKPDQAPYQQMAARLRADPFVHFLSLVLVPARAGETFAHLLVELTADGDLPQVRERLAAAIPQTLCEAFRATGNDMAPDRLEPFLRWHYVESSPSLGDNAGVSFAGTADMSVRRILDEAAFAARVRDILLEPGTGSALSRLVDVRSRIFADPGLKWAFVCEPMGRIRGPAQPLGRVAVAWSLWRHFFWPAALPPVITFIYSVIVGKSSPAAAAWHATLAAFAVGMAGLLFLWVAYRRLLRDEREDVPLDCEPDKARLEKILELEDQHPCVQNHVVGVSTIKPNWVRPGALRFALWNVERAVRGSRPGFIDKIGSIHFARWLRLPKTDRLVFLSNYDGSWQSYLEDFIARLRDGLTSVWSNTRDFPKTANLVEGGAGDGARFKRWARRQQEPSRFWYSGYPHLTAHRIRNNAAIRHGFASAGDEKEAAEWLALVGFAGRDSLETRDIPTLAFGGLSRLRFGHLIVVRFPDNDPKGAAARAWLGAVAPDVTYGDRTAKESAVVVGLSAEGLERMGLERSTLATFPMAFQQGMHKRARALGDTGPGRDWPTPDPHAVLVLYDAAPSGLDAAVQRRRKQLRDHGCQAEHEVPMAWLAPEFREAFGFRDGISQPVMRGTVRESRSRNSPHAVNPGELVLGYRDNLGGVPPVPSLRGRDIGRNGSFLVVRQLEQDTQGFEAYLDTTAQLLANDPRVPMCAHRDLKEWIGAKMVGRWKDGTSLVRFPHEPGTRKNPHATPDNGFMFGREDPDGLRCPFGAHVRRANPRDSFEPDSQLQVDISNRHRILRVGRNYDAAAGKQPGLLFMCVNADIERQFEFLQQSWILGPEFHGLQEEIDPIVACAGRRMIVPTPHGPLELPKLSAFVTLLGGGYFFMPGRGAVREIVAGAAGASPGPIAAPAQAVPA